MTSGGNANIEPACEATVGRLECAVFASRTIHAYRLAGPISPAKFRGV